MAAAAAAFDCQKIIDKIEERFKIVGLESLLEVRPDVESEFYVSLSKKEDIAEEIAHINGNSFGNGILYIETLNRYGFGSNNSTKGSGQLLLDLVACFAAKNNMTLTLVAMPDSAAEMPKNNMRLYNFYERAGLKPKGNERVFAGSRRKHYKTGANNLRKSLHERYKGGARQKMAKRRTRKL